VLDACCCWGSAAAEQLVRADTVSTIRRSKLN
jgi:hypothetical protein